jgi:hypothetical protein
MDKKPLIGVSILAVVLLVLGSLSNVVGYQTVQTSQQNLIKERIRQNIEVLDLVKHPLLYALIISIMTFRWNFGIKLRDISIETEPWGGIKIFHPLLLLWWLWIYQTIFINSKFWQSLSNKFGWGWDLPIPH